MFSGVSKWIRNLGLDLGGGMTALNDGLHREPQVTSSQVVPHVGYVTAVLCWDPGDDLLVP